MALYNRVKGTLDLLPEDSQKWRIVEQEFGRICQSFGYGEIRIPTFEYTEVFNRGVGETTDVVQKEMYTFEDRGGRSLTLRPEATAGVVRAFIENSLHNQPLPQRLYYEISAFRAENVQKGRYREFHQLGLECFGSDSPQTDVEIISLLHLFFQTVGLKDYRIKINSLGSNASRKQFYEELRKFLEPQSASLCSDCRNRLAKNPLRVLDCKVPSCQEIVKAAPAILDCLTEIDQARFNAVQAGLENLKIPFEIDNHIVRGLDYYCHTVFEFVLAPKHGAQAATICGGGRYDGLVALMGGTDLPGIGFSIGLERLMLALTAQEVEFKTVRPILFVVAVGDLAQAKAAKLVWQLRQAGIAAEQDLLGRSFKAQMKYLNKRNFRYCLVLGESELAQSQAKIKDLDAGQELLELFDLDNVSSLVATLKD